MKELEDANAVLDGYNRALQSLADARQGGEAADAARARADAVKAEEAAARATEALAAAEAQRAALQVRGVGRLLAPCLPLVGGCVWVSPVGSSSSSSSYFLCCDRYGGW